MSIGLADLYTKYQTWVRKNPQLISDSESILKWCSYILAGKFTLPETYFYKNVVWRDVLIIFLINNVNDRCFGLI